MAKHSSLTGDEAFAILNGQGGGGGGVTPAQLQEEVNARIEGDLALDDEKADMIENTASGSVVTFADGSGKNADELIVNIEPVQSGTGDPSPSNVRPISGWTGANVYASGKNLLNPSKLRRFGVNANYICTTSNGTAVDYASKGVIPVKPSTTYIFSYSSWYGDYKYYVWNASGQGTQINPVRVGSTFRVTTLADSVLISFYQAITHDTQITVESAQPQLEIGSVATSYEPYRGHTYSIAFPTEAGTVYGARINPITGQLAVDRANIASYNGETLPGKWISDRDVYSVGATPTTGAQVVYELAEPITYQLTPTEVATLVGNNTVYANTGNIISLSYKADTKAYVDSKIVETNMSMIAPTEDGTTASQAYAQGKYFIRNNQFCKAKTSIASGASFTLGTNYEVTTIAAELFTAINS